MANFDVPTWNQMRKTVTEFHEVLHDISMDSSFLNAEIDTRWAKMSAKENKDMYKILLEAFTDHRLLRDGFIDIKINGTKFNKTQLRGGEPTWATYNRYIHYELTQKGYQLFELITCAKNYVIAMDMDTLTPDMDWTFAHIEWSLEQTIFYPNKLALVCKFDPSWSRNEEVMEMIILEKMRRNYVKGDGVDEQYS